MIPTTTVQTWKLALIGLVAGLLSGGFGVGGGIVIVPLLLVVGLDRHRSHATSLASILPIAAAGAILFAASGEVDLRLGIVVGIGGVIGSSAGAAVMNRLSTRTLAIFFGLVILAAGIRMIFSTDPLPGANQFGDLAQISIALTIGVGSGFFAGVAGIGGGIVIVPATVLLLGFTQHEAQGTSLLAIILTSIAATVINRRNRRVDLRDALWVGIGGVVGSVAGSQLALGAEGQLLSALFGGFAVLVSIRTLYRALTTRPESAG